VRQRGTIFRAGGQKSGDRGGKWEGGVKKGGTVPRQGTVSGERETTPGGKGIKLGANAVTKRLTGSKGVTRGSAEGRGSKREGKKKKGRRRRNEEEDSFETGGFKSGDDQSGTTSTTAKGRSGASLGRRGTNLGQGNRNSAVNFRGRVRSSNRLPRYPSKKKRRRSGRS